MRTSLYTTLFIIYSALLTVLFFILFIKYYNANKENSEKEIRLANLTNLSSLINANYNDLIGKQYFDFNLEDTSGKPWQLSVIDAKIKIVILFNINDCATCLRDYRIYNSITEKYPKNIVFVIAISNNRLDEINSYIFQKKLKYKVLHDSHSIVNKIMGIHSSPLLFILNNNNKILDIQFPGQGSSMKLINKIDQILTNESRDALLKNKPIG